MTEKLGINNLNYTYQRTREIIVVLFSEIRVCSKLEYE